MSFIDEKHTFISFSKLKCGDLLFLARTEGRWSVVRLENRSLISYSGLIQKLNFSKFYEEFYLDRGMGS